MRQKRFQKIAVSLTVALSFAICGFLYSCQESGSTVRTEEQGLEDALPESLAEGNSSISSSELTSEASFVYVCGNVVRPGVYEVSADSRIFEVIEMAGGPKETGYVEALNLAERVYDGQKIYVPTYEEYSESVSGADMASDTKTALININTADEKLLMTLPGIGQARAREIIEYRGSHGNFNSIEDIMKVSGIKESAFNKIKDLICVQ